MIDTSPIIMNILIVLLCIFFIHIYWSNPRRKKNNKNVLILATGAICIFFVMTYPFTLEPGNIYDLRKIPIILATFYGSIPIGLTLTIGMLIYRVMIGGIGVILSFIVYALIFIAMILLKKKFDESGLKKRIVIATSIAGISSFLGPVMDKFSGVPILENEFMNFYIIFVLINSVVIAICVYIVERMLEGFQLRETMVNNEKLHVIGQLAASLAHEIRNPLTASRGFIQLLEEIVPDHCRRYTKISRDEMDRALSIIDDYLTFAKPEAHKRKKVNLKEVLEQVTQLLSPYTLLHNVTIVLNLKEGWVEGDRDKLLQCFVNLVKNAIESMPNGGDVRISLFQKKNHVVVSIEDQGIGMTKEEILRLGTPFYSMKEKGTGLGMMVVMSLIKNMDGSINFKSEPNKGTEVKVLMNSI
ncbi:ATP-binding protein [Cytobacillus sp. FJAT-54145]|uniref:histidine kinase n=1 Tax=Cytobacillus spartinae TaxID=3299023 RepID=A0ABW6KC11_9BACI